MSIALLNDAAKRAALGLSFVLSIAACGGDDVAASSVSTESNPASAPLPPGRVAPSDPASESPSASPDPSDPASSSNPSDPSGPNDDPDPSVPEEALNLRGTNLVGMEGGYGFSQSDGPVADKDYAVHSNQVVDYLTTKKVGVLRFLFSWERMQSQLGGPVPAAASGNYKTYFDNYKRIVDYATSKGMTVVMTPWQAGSSGAGGARWRGNLVGASTVTSEHFADFWAKMAALYKDNARVAIGLVNEPNSMSTMSWFATAQAAITAIRTAGFNGRIFVPGNGWTGAGSWTSDSVDSASPKRSNAYGWLNARGPGQPLLDPLGKSIVEIHSYADPDASGGSTDVTSTSTSRARVKVTVDWAKANGLKVWIGEIGMYADAKNAAANWSDFVSYANSSKDTVLGFAWWACGKPGWWNDVAANGGGHFSITPTNDYTSDTVNMKMVESAFAN